jgi:hypothetical protein
MRDEPVGVEPGRLECARATGGFLPRRQVVIRARDVPDARVTELDQVLRRKLARVLLVDADRRHVERVQRTVDEHDLRALVDEPRVVVVVTAQIRHLARDEDHSVDLAVEQHVHVIHLAKGCRGRRAQDRCEPRLGRALLDRLRE